MIKANFAQAIMNFRASGISLWLIIILALLSTTLEAQFLVGGNATSQGSGCYQLTPASNSQKGYVYKNAPINLHEPFDYRFSVFLGNNNGGADGMVFTLRGSLATPYIGNGGGAIGYQGSGFSNSIGIEVDTWYNGGFGDIAADHIGIFKNGTVNHTSTNSLAGPIQASSTSANVEDGNYHTLNVRWDPVSKKLSVYLDCNYRLQYQGDLIDSIFQGDSLVHWGFLASTGGANNVQGFCFTVPIDSFVTDLQDATICSGDSVQLNAGDSTCTYNWSSTGSLSSGSIPNPYASPTTTTTYYVTVSYQCDTLYDTSTVTVLPPTFSTSGSVTDALCKGDCNGAIDLTLTGASSYSYLWSDGSTTEDVNALCAGTYSVTVTDTVSTSTTYLCTITDDFTVSEPDKLFALSSNWGSTSCPDGLTCDGAGQASALGGTAPYGFLWTSGEVSNQALGLCSDTNYVSVTDDNGCVADTFAVIGVPDSIVTIGFGDTQICITNVAAMVATSTGGTAPYNYVWTLSSLTGPVVSTNVSATVSPELSSTYFVKSTDVNGCVGDTSLVVVRVRPELGVEMPHLDTICPYDLATFSAQGTGGDSLYSYSWSSGEFGAEITVGPNTSQWYIVTVSDFCGSPVFVDSVFQQVGGYSPIRATIRAEDDSICPGESIYLIARGAGGFGGPQEYRYEWNHTHDSNRIQFESPAVTSKYVVTITDLCLSPAGYDTLVIHTEHLQYPSIEVMPEEACAENDVLINIEIPHARYAYTWEMGDNNTRSTNGSDSSLVHQYDNVGCYDITVHVVSDFGCVGTKQFECAVKVLEQPVAAFDYTPEVATNVEPFILLENKSINASYWEWNFDNRTEVMLDSIIHEFDGRNNEYPIELTVISDDGCSDTIRIILHYKEETVIYYPSSFSPNEDGLNDEFGVSFEAVSPVDFSLKIHDRWGRQLFGSTSPNRTWNGKTTNGYLVPSGVYPFELRYRDETGELKVIFDDVTVSKTGIKTGLR